MYLGLFHGSEGMTRPEMEGMGDAGAMIGPLSFAHTTYASDIKLQFEVGADWRKYGFDSDNPQVFLVDDCIPFDGNLYGDWTVFQYKAK